MTSQALAWLGAIPYAAGNTLVGAGQRRTMIPPNAVLPESVSGSSDPLRWQPFSVRTFLRRSVCLHSTARHDSAAGWRSQPRHRSQQRRRVLPLRPFEHALRRPALLDAPLARHRNIAGDVSPRRCSDRPVRFLRVNETFTIARVIRGFADAESERFYSTGRSRRFPPDIRGRAAKRLTQLNAAVRIEDLRLPPSNRLEPLKGDRKGQWSIRINDQWRVCFRFEKGDAPDVEIVDYH